MLRHLVGITVLTHLFCFGCSGETGGSVAANTGGTALGNGGASTGASAGNSNVAQRGGSEGLGQGGAATNGGAHSAMGSAAGHAGRGTETGGTGTGVGLGGGGSGGDARGGAQNQGGAGTGGKATGGSSNGGSSNGGSSNGGGAGGVGNGGASSTGGNGKGGTNLGGVSNGGASKGGSTATGGSGGGTTKITVWVAGDSTVQTCSSACPCGWASPAAFGSYFNGNVTINNQAISGRSIQTWMYEPNVTSTAGSDGECVVTETNSTRWATVSNGLKAGDYFFIQFGINDGSSTCPRHVGSTRYKTLLTRLAQTALDKGAHPILLTPTGAIKCSGGSAVATRGFITETKAVGTTLGVPVIDLHALSTALYNTLGFCPLPAGNTDITATTGGAVGEFFCNDHTHFSATGAKQLAGAVAKAVRDQAIPLSAYLL